MPPPPDDVLLSMQSSLRNALASFGPDSRQYLMIKHMVAEYEAKLALESLSLEMDDGMER
ncbi:uncharacterized protein M421DRAFT_425279 [Didymella exigua CBS 183.55]|uniref:Uncharacterized protein n=1 Tax=Didymella exigua CBS 183.55 TaxID=1150837 RepID=A0A6A5R9R5_9PLEO|nr:uncharacterized protein M421DRAFT_425279 [Didymella exigua CBS 183.55]KAF1923938.1 hypothetical protein M421DRAFT_425279 [Didymella exigua CBS 183.55]